MTSPQLAWEFMKKLSKSPWAPIIRLLDDPDVLPECNLDLKEDLEDCALVVEETDTPVTSEVLNQGDSHPRKPGSESNTSSSDNEDSSSYSGSSNTSEDTSSCSGSNKAVHGLRKLDKPPKNKRHPARSQITPSRTSSQKSTGTDGNISDDDTVIVITDGGYVTDKSIVYYGQRLKLKVLKIVLIDLVRVNEQLLASHSKSTLGGNNSCNHKRPLDSDSGPSSHKRQKIGHGVDDAVQLVSPSGSAPLRKEINRTAKTMSNPPKPSTPNNPFELNAWRLALVVKELERLFELSKKLQTGHVKLEAQKSIAYKIKYGLNEVARLVTKRSLKSIVTEHELLEAEKDGGTDSRHLKKRGNSIHLS